MANSKNVVIAGDYSGKVIYTGKVNGLCIVQPSLFKKNIYINKNTVDSYEVFGQENTKSMASGIVRGTVGGALFGGAGMVAGANSAKNKGIYTVSIVFQDGTKCLCDIDDAMYKHLVTVLY